MARLPYLVILISSTACRTKLTSEYRAPPSSVQVLPGFPETTSLDLTKSILDRWASTVANEWNDKPDKRGNLPTLPVLRYIS
ncbi:hypothetical protein C7212DRAFT_327926 [Tuber magnatum]|uniref:Uncharacterized protein n=1 Tax=Tuber magnatum TaxID=42249 RepID=A0A317SJI7_9PEZI|nr:hypothetical protein C7212DRAFT_327926 [Tuber magnatum]